MSEPAAAVAEDGGAVAATPAKESPEEPHRQQNSTPPSEVVSVELPAPPGWKKTFTPRKGGTPRRNEIIFIAPTGEEIKNKRQLELYLKSHNGGLSTSDFDWGTGDTPRRSARISERVKAMETPEGEPPMKRGRKSGSKKGGKESETEAKEGAAVGEENEEGGDLAMKEAEDGKEGGIEDMAAAEEKGDNSDVAMEEVEAGAEGAKDDALIADEKEGNDAAKKETQNGAEKVRDTAASEGMNQEKDKEDANEDNYPKKVVDGKTQAEEHINDKSDVAETVGQKEKIEQEQRSETLLVEKEIKATGILPENGSLKD